jgi:hypothetical protein
LEKQISISYKLSHLSQKTKKLQPFTEFWWYHTETTGTSELIFNPLNAMLNPTCHQLALLETLHIFHVSGLILFLVIFIETVLVFCHAQFNFTCFTKPFCTMGFLFSAALGTPTGTPPFWHV